MKRLIAATAALAATAIQAQPYMTVNELNGDTYTFDTQEVDYIAFSDDYTESTYTDESAFRQKYFILPQNELPEVDESLAEIGEISKESGIARGVFYPVCEDGKISDIFRYSLPVAMRNSATNFLANQGLRPSTPKFHGMTIEFYADCSEFEIKSYFGFTAYILIDGKRINTERIADETTSEASYLPVKFSEKKKRLVKIYYYGTSFMGIVTDGELHKYNTRRLLICGDGDSVVAGYSNANGLYFNWLSIVGHKLDLDIYNVGVGGSGFIKIGNNNTPNMPDRFDQYITPISPDILIFSAGINDMGQDSATFETQVDTYFQKATALNNCKVVACSPYCNVVKPGTAFERMNETIRRRALLYHVPFIDYMHAMTYDANGNCITNNLGTEAYHNILTAENIGTYLNLEKDKVHPNLTGHNAIGTYIAHELYKVLNRMEGF